MSYTGNPSSIYAINWLQGWMLITWLGFRTQTWVPGSLGVGKRCELCIFEYYEYMWITMGGTKHN